MMESKRKRSKGGFFNLFDWNRKPNKPFAYDSDSHGGSQGLCKSHLQRVDESSQNNSCSEFSCASSVISDEGSCVRPTNVVAKLMGLDFMPSFDSDMPSSSRSFSLRSPGCYWNHTGIGCQINSPSQRLGDGYVWNPMDVRRNKTQSKSAELFQREILRSKNPRNIPINHQNVLSPIKSPRKNASKDYQREMHGKVLPAPNRISELKQTIKSPQKSPVKRSTVPRTLDGTGTEKNGVHIVRRNGASSSPTRIDNMKPTKDFGTKSNMTNRRSPPNKCSAASERSKNTATTLKQNDRKQNGLVNKVNSNVSKVKPVQQARRAQTVNDSMPGRNVKKIVPKPATRTRKAAASPSQRKTSTSFVESSINTKVRDAIGSDIVSFNKETNFKYCGASKSTDVVSFTFSSPIRAKSSSQPLVDQSLCYYHQICLQETVDNPDAVSFLLEQNLKELTEKVQSSNTHFIKSNSFESTQSDTQNLPRVDPVYSETTSQICSDDLGNIQTHHVLECLDPSSDLITQTLYNNGGKKCYWGQGVGLEQRIGISSISMSNVVIGRKTDTLIGMGENSGGMIRYLKRILHNAPSMLHEFIIGRTSTVVEPNDFILWDNLRRPGQIEPQLCEAERKLLFDCASECLDLMCAQVSFCEPQALATIWKSFQREGWAAEMVYKEILHWRSMADLLVDEVIDNDMSYRYGKWVDFEVEELEECLRLEAVISSSLLDELVSDLFPS